jgi:UDP-N-acetylglucosamine 2-epimerase (non-hydrolysing)
MAVPVFHMEAGNRCYDDRVPEEVNRRIIDHASDVLMPYTERSRANLLREGIAGRRIFVTGNPILEVIEHYRAEIDRSMVLRAFDIEPGGYFWSRCTAPRMSIGKRASRDSPRRSSASASATPAR